MSKTTKQTLNSQLLFEVTIATFIGLGVGYLVWDDLKKVVKSFKGNNDSDDTKPEGPAGPEGQPVNPSIEVRNFLDTDKSLSIIVSGAGEISKTLDDNISISNEDIQIDVSGKTTTFQYTDVTVYKDFPPCVKLQN